MIIYIVYERLFADLENGEDNAVYINKAYRSKRKAIKKAKELMKEAKKYFYIDENIQKLNNPFKKNNVVDFYKEKQNQEKKISSIIIEETKLIA